MPSGAGPAGFASALSVALGLTASGGSRSIDRAFAELFGPGLIRTMGGASVPDDRLTCPHPAMAATNPMKTLQGPSQLNPKRCRRQDFRLRSLLMEAALDRVILSVSRPSHGDFEDAGRLTVPFDPGFEPSGAGGPCDILERAFGCTGRQELASCLSLPSARLATVGNRRGVIVQLDFEPPGPSDVDLPITQVIGLPAGARTAPVLPGQVGGSSRAPPTSIRTGANPRVPETSLNQAR